MHLYNIIRILCKYNTIQQQQWEAQMGNCYLCPLIRSQKSQLRQQSLIKHEQLITIIKQSTQNDKFFYSSPNLSTAEQLLTQFTKKGNTHIDHEKINSHINTIVNFIRDLRDKGSEVGTQFQDDQRKVTQYLSSNRGSTGAKIEDLVVLRLQLQTLLMPAALIQDIIQHDEEWFINIQQLYAQNLKKTKTPQPQKQPQGSIYPIHSIQLTNQQLQKALKDSKPQNSLNHSSSKAMQSRRNTTIANSKLMEKVKDQNQLQQIMLFATCQKVVHRNSKIRITLSKGNRRGSPSVMSQNAKNLSKVVGQTSLSVSDFIYYSSLLISDVVSLNPPTSIKSSISTTTSQQTNQNAVGFISLRGQGLQAHCLDKDYIKIIKQHEVVVRQLQHCLEGEKGWEKLSEYKDSAESYKNKSYYSEYSVPQGVPNYKL